MQFGKCFVTAVLALLSVRTMAVPAPSAPQGVPASSVSQIDAPGSTYREAPGSTYTDAIGINSRGDIVGSFNDSQFRRHGYILSRGSFTILDAEEGASTIPSDINDRGQVVGWYVKNGFHGFLWDHGEFTDINAPGGADTFVDRINNRGEMAVRVRPGIFAPTRAMLVADGAFSRLNIPEDLAVAEFTLGLNDRGQIVGAYLSQGRPHAFMIARGVFAPIEVPDAVRSTASGINNHGEIVGSYHDAAGVEHAYLRRTDGSYTVIDATNASGITGMGINERSDIVGRFSVEGGGFHGFLWSR